MNHDDLLEFATARGLNHRDVLRLGSLSTLVACDSERYLDFVLALFRTLRGQHVAVATSAVGARILVFEAEHAAGVTAESPPDGLDVTTLGSGRWRIATDAITAHVRAGHPSDILLAVRQRPEDEFGFRVHLSVCLHRALFLLGRLYVHAAGVAWADSGTALIGEKGSGKSTLSLALGAAGATVLCDDHLVLRRDNKRFFASGCDSEARVLPDAEFHLFGGAVDAPVVELGGVRKREIRIERYFRSGAFHDYRLDRIVFPKVGRRFSPTPIAKRDALVRLIGATRDSHRFSDASDYDAYLDFLASFTNSVEAFAVELSPHLSELASFTEWCRDAGA